MTLVLSAALCGSGGQPCQPKQRAAGDVIHLFHVVPTVASASDGTPGDPGLAALADVPVAVTHTDPAQDAANVRPSFNLYILKLTLLALELAAWRQGVLLLEPPLAV